MLEENPQEPPPLRQWENPQEPLPLEQINPIHIDENIFCQTGIKIL